MLTHLVSLVKITVETSNIPIYAKELALASLPGHLNDRTMRESNLRYVKKGVSLHMYMTAAHRQFSFTSSSKLLFTY